MGDIKTRFAIEGEQQYRSAMTSAANAIKVLNSEQKLAKAQFENTGNAEKYAAQQADILRQKIVQQQQAVKAAESALKQLSDNGVAKNSAQYQKWQTKLNNAQTALTKMETELKNVDNSMKQTSEQANSTSTALESIGKKVSLDAVINGVGKITDNLEAAAKKAIELGQAIVNSMRESASWADELETEATVYGYSTEDLQRMRYTADILDTSTDTIVKSRQKLVNAMQSESAAFDDLGVNIREASMGGKYGDVSGELRNWEDVFWDLGDALVRIENEKGLEYVNKQAQQLLGKSWEQLKPIFNSDWASEDNYLGRAFNSAREYYEAIMGDWDVVSDENVKKLSKLDNAYQTLENNFETLQNTVLANLAPGFTDLTNIVSGLLEELNKYLASDEGQQKLADLSDAVVSLFEGLSDIDFGTVLDTAKGALDSLTNGLKWIKNNWSSVVSAVEGIAVALGLLKVSEKVLTFMQLLSSGKYLFSGGAGAAGGAASGAGAAAGGAGASAGTGAAASAGIGVGGWATLGGIGAVGLAIADVFHEAIVVTGQAIELGNQSIERSEEIRQMHPEYVGKDIWEALNGYTSVGGVNYETDMQRMDEFAKRYWDYLYEGAEDAGLDRLLDLMDIGLSDEFNTAMEEYISGMGDKEELEKVFTKVRNLLEEDMKNNPAEVETTPTLTDNASELISSQLQALGTFAVNIIPNIFGLKDLFSHSFANGISSVPYDGMLARLHKGERVVPAREVQSRSYNSNLYVESMYMNNGTDAAGLAAAMAAAQRRTMSGFGS